MSETNSRRRLGVVGVIVIALFSGLFARLWFLQVASTTDYVAQTTANRTRTVTEPAMRGTILDRNGKPIVLNTLVDTVQIQRGITEEERQIAVPRLAEVLGMKVKDIDARLDSGRYSPYEPVPIADEVTYDQVVQIKENPELFPKVRVVRRSVRSYPNGELGAHLLGYVGAINGTEQQLHKGSHYGPDDVIGKTGVEQIFESELRGKPRVQKLEVDSRGRLVQVLSDTPSEAGNDVKLTVDLEVQRILEESLAQGIAAARAQRDFSITERRANFEAPGGAAIVLDAKDGSIVALGSYPTFPLSAFTSGIPFDQFQALTDASSNQPLLNRVIQGTYAPGSTFKPFSAMAGLEAGIVAADELIDDPGYVEVGSGSSKRRFENAQKKAHGVVTLPQAIAVSSDVYFYKLGFRFFSNLYSKGDKEKGDQIQTLARQFGFSKSTGSGFLNEAVGRIPDEKFKLDLNKDNPDESTRTWLPGDIMNLAIGQGDVLVTPIQLASAYATLVNGGKKFSPRLASQIRTPGSTATVRDLPAQPAGSVKLKAEFLDPILEGLKGVTAGGTATAAFAGFNYPTAGKTGTAQVLEKQDTSVFAGILNPDADPSLGQYVVVVFVEQAGFGSAVAAPIARRIMESLTGNLSPEPVRVTFEDSGD